MNPFFKKKEMKTFDWCYGMACNWADIKTGVMYYIQEYREAMDKGEKPQGIRTSMGTYISEYQLRDLIKDPEPDPRYTAETPAEHRRNW